MVVTLLTVDDNSLESVVNGIEASSVNKGLLIKVPTTKSVDTEEESELIYIEPSTEKVIIQEPCRCPIFRSAIEPNVIIEGDNIPAYEVATTLGSVKHPNKTYEAIKATYYGGEQYVEDSVTKYRIRGELMRDSSGNQLYLKRRVPKTSSDMLVLRNGTNTGYEIKWKYIDGADFQDKYWLPCKPFLPYQHGVASPRWDDGTGGIMALWETTTDIKKAQLDYDYALCRNMDWSELLIEGDVVVYKEHNVEVEVTDIDSNGVTQPNKIVVHFPYYEVYAPSEYWTPVEGQADIVLQVVTPEWADPANQVWPPDTFTIANKTNQNELEPPDSPDFELVYLDLINNSIPKYHKTQGICNDCTQPRVRGVFIRKDIMGRKYPMLFEVATLRVGGAIRSRKVDCYYKTENDNCSPRGIQPEMRLIRQNEWRLTLDPNTCAITCTELNDNTNVP